MRLGASSQLFAQQHIQVLSPEILWQSHSTVSQHDLTCKCNGSCSAINSRMHFQLVSVSVKSSRSYGQDTQSNFVFFVTSFVRSFNVMFEWLSSSRIFFTSGLVTHGIQTPHSENVPTSHSLECKHGTSCLIFLRSPSVRRFRAIAELSESDWSGLKVLNRWTWLP